MKNIRNIPIFALFLLAGTHAVPELRLSIFGFSTPYSILIFYFVLSIALLKVVANRGKTKFSATLFHAFLVYYLSIAVSSIFAVQIDYELLFKWLLFPLIPICVALTVDRVRVLNKLLISFAISGFFVFCFGIYGFITEEVGDPLQHTFGYFGVTYEESSRNGDVLYFQSTFWILLSIALYADRVSKSLRAFCGLLAVMVAMGLVLSLARGAWLSGALTVIALVAIQRSVKRKSGVTERVNLPTKLAMIMLFLAGFLYIFISTVEGDYQQILTSRTDSFSTFSEEGGNSNLARYLLLMRAAEVAITHPLGVGVWNLKYHLTDFYISGLASAENIYIHMLAEQGLLGVGAYLFILGWIGRRLYRFIVICGSGSDKWVGWCLMCILINWSLYGMFNIMIETLWYWLGISLTVAAGNLVERGALKKVVEIPPCKPQQLKIEREVCE